MKIHLKRILAVKRLLVLSIPIIVMIAAGSVYFFGFRKAPPETAVHAPPEANPVQIPARPRTTSLKPKIRVIKPVNVVDDVFKGYDLPSNDPEAEKSAGDSDPEAVREDSAERHMMEDKDRKNAKAAAMPEHERKREVAPREEPVSSSIKEPAEISDEGLKHLNERLKDSDLSEENKKKLTQSYLELRKVLPEKEAQKMIMWQMIKKRDD